MTFIGLTILLLPIVVVAGLLTVIVWVFCPELWMGMATICFAPVFGFVWMAWILMGPPPPAPKKYVKSSQYEWWYKTKF